MNFNEFQQHRSVSLPKTVIRSVSLDKIAKGTPLTQNPFCMNLLNKKLAMSKPQSKVYQKQKINPLKLQSLRAQTQKQQLRECTFKPQINEGNLPKRSIDTFYKDQLVYKEKNDVRITQMREMIRQQITKENTFQPNIDIRERKQHQTTNVHSRLYDDAKSHGLTRNSSKDTINSRQNNNQQHTRKALTHRSNQSNHNANTFIASNLDKHSSTPLNRIINVDYQTLKHKLIKDQRHPTPISLRSLINPNKQSILQVTTNKARQLLKQMKEMSVDLPPLSLSFQQMKLFLMRMQSNEVCETVWQLLRGSESGVELMNLFKVLFSLNNIHDQQIIQKCLDGIPYDKILILSQSDSKKLNKQLKQIIGNSSKERNKLQVVNNENNCSNAVEKEEKKNQQVNTPIVFLNIVTEGRKDVRVPVFNYDTLNTVIQKVRVLLDLQSTADLHLILKQQIAPALAKIGIATTSHHIR